MEQYQETRNSSACPQVHRSPVVVFLNRSPTAAESPPPAWCSCTLLLKAPCAAPLRSTALASRGKLKGALCSATTANSHGLARKMVSCVSALVLPCLRDHARCPVLPRRVPSVRELRAMKEAYYSVSSPFRLTSSQASASPKGRLNGRRCRGSYQWTKIRIARSSYSIQTCTNATTIFNAAQCLLPSAFHALRDADFHASPSEGHDLLAA